MRFRTALHTISDTNLRATIIVPLVNCKSEPLAEIHVPKLEELRLIWDSVYAKKLALDDKASEAQARVNNASITLNRTAGRVAKAILIITDDKRTDPLYTAYLGDKSPSEFKRRFGAKLTVMRGWSENLKVSEHPSLAALAGDVEQAVKAAEAAATMREDVASEKRYFRDVGERKKLIDKTNAVCKSIHGELSMLPHEIPGLPPDFADRFFFSERREDDDEDAEDTETVEAARAQVDELKEKLAAAEEHLKKVIDEEAAAKVAAAELEAEKAKLAALEAEVAAKKAQAAALKEKLEKRMNA